jgi:exosortase H (IPTLxxWG-CTERM-specific)
MRHFVLVFACLLAPLFVVELTAPVQQFVVAPWTGIVAVLSGVAASWIDPGTVTSGASLINPASGFGVTIVAGCNGVEATLILVAAILAYPASASRKLAGIAAGFIAVQGLNLVRVVSLFFLGQWSFAAFEFAHLYLWQGLIMLDVLVVWLVWLRMLPAAHAQPLAA